MSVIKHKFVILFLFIFTPFASAEISQTEKLNNSEIISKVVGLVEKKAEEIENERQ